MTTPGSFSLHPSEKYESLEFVVFDLGDRRHIISRRLYGRGSSGQILMMARAKHLGREFAGRACAEDALSVIRIVPADADHFESENQADEWILLDKVANALTTALGNADAFTSAMAFCKILKISGSDALFHAFHDRWRPAAVPTEEMLLEAAREMEEMLEEQFKGGYAEDFARIRSGNTPEIQPR